MKNSKNERCRPTFERSDYLFEAQTAVSFVVATYTPLTVFSHPRERGELVEETLVAAGGQPLPEAVAQAQEAERAVPRWRLAS